VDRPRPGLWRITDRSSFVRLREHGRRARHGLVSVTYLGPSDGETNPPRAGFAISKAAGGAVTRNRIKRRLRAALRELQRDGALPNGTYLITGRTEVARQPWSDLVSDLGAAIREVAR
jgi:ribonuclease P protein component